MPSCPLPPLSPVQVQYCSAECQRAHWKSAGGHKAVCKAAQAARAAIGGPVKAFADLAAEMERAAATADGCVTEGGSCYVCLEIEPSPIRLRCACRGNAGWAHVECQAAVANRAEESGLWTGLNTNWVKCKTCHQSFGGAMEVGLVHARWRKAERLAETDWRRLIPLVSMGRCMSDYGMCADAVLILRRALTVVARISTPDDPNIHAITYYLAMALASQGEYAEAEALMRHLHAATLRMFGPDHDSTLTTAEALASVLTQQNKHDESGPIYESVLAGYRRSVGTEHHSTLTCASSWILCLTEQLRIDEAEAATDEYLPIMKRVLGSEHNETLLVNANLARCMISRGRLGEAESILAKTAPTQERVCGRNSAPAVQSSTLLGSVRTLILHYGPVAPVDWEENYRITVEQAGPRLTSAEFMASNRAK
jgi:hypothetical protein